MVLMVRWSNLNVTFYNLQYSDAPPVPVTPAIPVVTQAWCAVATYVFLQKIQAACTTDPKAIQERCRCEKSCACHAGGYMPYYNVSCGENEKCQLIRGVEIFHPKLKVAHCSLDETLYTTFEV